MSKLRFSGELSWALGVIGMAMGVALVSVSSFGYSMIAAPVYLIYRRLDLLSFGTVEYLYQGALLLLMCVLVRRFRPRYLCSFVTAVVYGLMFDLCLLAAAWIPEDLLAVRWLCFLLGELFIVVSVVLFLHTDMAPEVYELFVKELTDRYGLDFGRVKLVYDIALLVLSIALSLILFGPGALSEPERLLPAMFEGYILEGIGIGTLIAAFINGPLISACDRLLTARIAFEPAQGIGRLLRY